MNSNRDGYSSDQSSSSSSSSDSESSSSNQSNVVRQDSTNNVNSNEEATVISKENDAVQVADVTSNKTSDDGKDDNRAIQHGNIDTDVDATSQRNSSSSASSRKSSVSSKKSRSRKSSSSSSSSSSSESEGEHEFPSPRGEQVHSRSTDETKIESTERNEIKQNEKENSDDSGKIADQESDINRTTSEHVSKTVDPGEVEKEDSTYRTKSYSASSSSSSSDESEDEESKSLDFKTDMISNSTRNSTSGDEQIPTVKKTSRSGTGSTSSSSSESDVTLEQSISAKLENAQADDEMESQSKKSISRSNSLKSASSLSSKSSRKSKRSAKKVSIKIESRGSLHSSSGSSSSSSSSNDESETRNDNDSARSSSSSSSSSSRVVTLQRPNAAHRKSPRFQEERALSRQSSTSSSTVISGRNRRSRTAPGRSRGFHDQVSNFSRFHQEYMRMERSMKELAKKNQQKQPQKGIPYKPFTWNNLAPYYNLDILRYVVHAPVATHRGYITRATSSEIVDPEISLKMDNSFQVLQASERPQLYRRTGSRRSKSAGANVSKQRNHVTSTKLPPISGNDIYSSQHSRSARSSSRQ